MEGGGLQCLEKADAEAVKAECIAILEWLALGSLMGLWMWSQLGMDNL